ncbi:LysR family transcriptional regulator [Cloacibacillus sp. An23]|uniref:LysR family transcriptional regulator n=1 Tax=Cloacibacillus sp. An23 TaxID=1965591 RepID=UPI000B3A02F6|nr:LysR family transcriptional regulator [Cloacibacillus sp. An23]OUO93765.1 transcriptional regulator [Cloacibacillus sp. An23]
MDIQSLYYFAELSKDLHITRTAERLHISQQTLSNHLLRLEKYFGARLVERSQPTRLTSAGEYVLSFAEKLGRDERNLKDMLSDAGRQERGTLRIGGSEMRLNAFLPEVLCIFGSKYPKVDIRLTSATSSVLEPLVESGALDYGVVLSQERNPALNEWHLMEDQVYLCVADSLLAEYYGDGADALKRRSLSGAELGDFAELPFCMLSNRMGTRIKECFDGAGVTPRRLLTSPNTQIGLSLCRRRKAACFATRMNLADSNNNLEPDINVFPLHNESKPITQRLSIIRRKDRYISRFAKFFLDTTLDYFENLGQMRMERLARSE